MDRDQYKRWNNHPLRSILRACATNADNLPSRTQLQNNLTEAGIPDTFHARIIKRAERIVTASQANSTYANPIAKAKQLADELSLELTQELLAEDSLLRGSGTENAQSIEDTMSYDPTSLADEIRGRM